MLNDEKLVDAVRVVGQLLLHRPTSRVMSRDLRGDEVNFRSPKACRFCYVGACNVVNLYLFGPNAPMQRDIQYKIGKDTVYGNKVSKACDEALGICVDGGNWDAATSAQQKAWAQKLADFEG
jgi:hypothetical protein